MKVTLILGSQWGDEGKGKLTDYLLSKNKFGLCARAAGGHNAGHSVKIDGQSYSFHLLPSGLMDPNTDNLIGSGVVFNCEAFFKELDQLTSKGVPRVHERIHISSRCHLNFALYAAVDGLSERELGTNQIGTTKRGIGPAYSTKAARDGLRVVDLYHESFEQKLRSLAEGYRKRYGEFKYSVEDEIVKFREYKEQLQPYIVDVVDYMRVVEEKQRSVLVEGSQALMLDLDFGSYPFVTSSHCSLGGCMQGLALSPFAIENVIGVVKAYTTRVGGGPFPTEQDGNDIGNTLQEVGGEIGVSTGRRRRCGWLDLVVLKYSTAVNHYTCINLTKLDVLDSFATIQVGVAYITSDGKKLETFPADLNVLEKCTVEYVGFEGWQSSTKGAQSWSDLPAQAQKYIDFIESSIGVKVSYIGTGQDREDMIIRE
jgi:adenylosuccinate synthase